VKNCRLFYFNQFKTEKIYTAAQRHVSQNRVLQKEKEKLEKIYQNDSLLEYSAL
jgi:hypothetical protein